MRWLSKIINWGGAVKSAPLFYCLLLSKFPFFTTARKIIVWAQLWKFRTQKTWRSTHQGLISALVGCFWVEPEAIEIREYRSEFINNNQ
jgi:hypothetical protein